MEGFDGLNRVESGALKWSRTSPREGPVAEPGQVVVRRGQVEGGRRVGDESSRGDFCGRASTVQPGKESSTSGRAPIAQPRRESSPSDVGAIVVALTKQQ